MQITCNVRSLQALIFETRVIREASQSGGDGHGNKFCRRKDQSVDPRKQCRNAQNGYRNRNKGGKKMEEEGRCAQDYMPM